MAPRPGLVDHLFLRLSLVAGCGLVLLCAVWVGVELAEFARRADETRQNHHQSSQIQLKRIVDDVREIVAFERHRVEARVENGLRARVDEAQAVILNLLATQGRGRTAAELENLVREALRPVRFNNNRGYFFAFDLNGDEKLFPDRPQLDGPRGEVVVRDMLRLVRSKGGGLYRYYWSKPGQGSDDHLKFAYVRAVPQLGWVIGTGEYVEDMEGDIQAEVLERIAHIRFDGDGYVFVSQWDGLSLVGALKGLNPLADPGSPLRDATRKLIETAKAGGGFVTYDMLDGHGGMVSKTSYVAAIDDWGWFVGAGLTQSSLERQIAAQRRQLLNGLFAKGAVAAMAAMAVALAGVVVMRVTSRRVARDAEVLARDLDAAAERPEPIAVDGLRFAEHHHFAEAANRLIRRRQEVEQQLLDRSAQLEQTNADLERFAYVASHDLQEPLRTIGLFLQLLRRRVGSQLDAEALEYIEYAVGGADRMRNNIQGLLAYSRSSHPGDARPDTDLNGVLGQVLTDLSGAIVATGARVETEDLPVVPADPGQMAALFLNLIGNAIRYRFPGRDPRVCLSARQTDGGWWEFAVADNGIGIPAEYRGAIFEPFRRFHPPGMEGGSGIGLALCRRVVESHGGRIWVEAGNPGSIFRFTLGGAGVRTPVSG